MASELFERENTHIYLDRYSYRYVLLHMDMVDSTTDKTRQRKNPKDRPNHHIAHTLFYGRIILLRVLFFNTKKYSK